MISRLASALAGLAAALLLACPAAAAATPAAAAGRLHRIVAIGDLHGDFAAWRAIALAAGLIDPAGRWTGGPAVLVQTGDVVDRGPDGRRIIADLMRLQREAPRAGGRVIALVGNHEAMNMTGDLRYVSAADDATYADSHSQALREQVFTANKAKIEAAYLSHDPTATPDAIKVLWLKATPPGALERQLAWAPDGQIGRWVVGNPAVVELDGALFVHGGISPAYVQTPIDEINRRVAAALKAADAAPDAIINAEDGPLWYRGLVAPGASPRTADAEAAASPAAPPPPVAEQLDVVLKAFDARRIVIAHTPILSGIAILEGGRLVRIDTGISAAYGGKLTYLDIIDGVLRPHEVARPAAQPRETK